MEPLIPNLLATFVIAVCEILCMLSQHSSTELIETQLMIL